MDEQNNTVEQIETNLSKLKDVQKETFERAQKRWLSRYKRWLSKAEDWISKHNSAKSSAATSDSRRPPKKSDPVADYVKRLAEAQKQSLGGLQTFA